MRCSTHLEVLGGVYVCVVQLQWNMLSVMQFKTFLHLISSDWSEDLCSFHVSNSFPVKRSHLDISFLCCHH
jgi:hypothetical protein